MESNQIPKGTSRLAGGSYPHQGLLSIVLITGLEPITSDVSDRRSHQLSYMSGCGTGRTRTYNLLINSQVLHQLRYCSILLWEQVESNHQADVLQTRAGPCRYSLVVHSTGFEPMTFELTARCSTSELLVLFVVGADGIEPPSRCFTDTSRTLPILPKI